MLPHAMLHITTTCACCSSGKTTAQLNGAGTRSQPSQYTAHIARYHLAAPMYDTTLLEASHGNQELFHAITTVVAARKSSWLPHELLQHK